MPLFSICIPAHNAVCHIFRAFESIAKQTCSNWEIVIVDDASSDGLYSYLDEQSIIDRNKISYFRFENNYGPFLARRQAFAIAKGEYILCLDSDDEFTSLDALEQIEKIIRDKRPDCIFLNATVSLKKISNWIDYSNIKNQEGWLEKDSVILTFASSYKLNNLWLKVIKREYLKSVCQIEYDGLKMCEDRLEVAGVLYLAKNFYLLDKPLYYYYQNPASTTHAFFDFEYCRQQAYVERRVSSILGLKNEACIMQQRKFLSTWADDMKLLTKGRSLREIKLCFESMRKEPLYIKAMESIGTSSLRLDKAISLVLLWRNWITPACFWTIFLMHVTTLIGRITKND